MLTRLLLLSAIAWITRLTTPLIAIPIAPSLWKMMPDAEAHAGMLGMTGRGLILLGGGLFLLWKATREIHHSLEAAAKPELAASAANFVGVLIQIALIDIIFSLDSVITAVGMADHLSVMALAVILSVAIMMLAAAPIGEFITRHPSLKMLALSFLLLIATALIAEGLHFDIPKGYIYFAMAFSLAVELLNLRARAKLIAGGH